MFPSFATTQINCRESLSGEVSHKTTTRTMIVVAVLALQAMAAREVEAGARRPNIVVIMADDMGFSDIACYGSEIRTPNLDRLAAGGLRFTQFYNTARCCPTRAALLTGLASHRAGVGRMVDGDKSAGRGYLGELAAETVTIPEVLQSAGYRSYMSGKWHIARTDHQGPEGPKHNWPMQRGFSHFFGTINGAGSYFAPATLTVDNEQVPKIDDGFYYTDAISTAARKFVIEHHRNHNDAAFFLYVAYTAPHWPRHALTEDIERYGHTYQIGWDVLRKQRYAKQLELGVFATPWPISPRTPGAPEWSELNRSQQKNSARRMAIYAAQIDRMDQGIGQIIDTLQETGEFDNTLIFFLSDNGACDETGSFGFDRKSKELAKLGTEPSFSSYGLCWANASNTPFKRFKKDHYEGGIASPLIVHWPKKITEGGQFRRQPGHVIDIMATCLDVAGADYPESKNGLEVPAFQGRSLVPAFEDLPIDREALYWEHVGNRAIRVDGWKLVLQERDEPNPRWRLYHLADDRSELHDLSELHPGKVVELKGKWNEWAAANFVLPRNRADAPSKIDVDAGLVAHYRFDNNPDNQGGEIYPLRIDNAVFTDDRFHNDDSAYQFDGLTSSIWVDVHGFPEFQSPQSFSWWFFTHELQTYEEENGAGNMIVVADAEGGSGLQFGFRAPGYNTLGLDTWKWGGGTLLEITPPAINSWHHCAYTFDGTTHRFYLDGKEMTSSTVTPQKGAPTTLMFGNYPTGDQFFHGKLDDVRIYDRVLSRHEIELLFQATR